MPLRGALPLSLLTVLACAGGTAQSTQTPSTAQPAGPAGAAAPAPAPGPGAAGAPASSIAARTAGAERRDGFVPVYIDRGGRVLLELPRDSARMLMLVSLATGLGSNPVGLDRGANAGEYVVRFDREGDRVLVVFENWSYRSSAADNPDHQRSVAESFPPSTVAALPLQAAEGGRLLVDATDFLLRDWADVTRTLGRAGQGTYNVDRQRSSVYRPYTRAFPDNTELDASLTFAAANLPGRIVEQVAPHGSAITLRQHVSLVRLPDAGYRPRRQDPRVGYFGIAFHDFAQPVQQPLVQRWASRHRLTRTDPRDPRSPLADTIVYYIDRGMPEPIRTASLEGARFWEEAFRRAGLPGAFRVELLPEGADPMDVRYNVVQWENRNERGWSIGGSLSDPRTGEILKGMARMDSHRARTDYNLYAGLLGADASAADTAFVLARVRQVTSHEIGHTLGLQHNYIASAYERGSVMDYPPPRVSLTPAGEIDVSEAYDVGPGEYDVWAIRWGYGIFPPESEADSLRAIVAEGLRKGFLYLSDADARPEFGSDPRVNLWDDRATAAEFLRSQMAVRRVALRRFGERNIRPGQPVALLQERLAPVYFMHRFAISSASKTIGGMEYSNPVRGDAQQATRPIGGNEQRRALALLLGALRPDELEIPDTVVTLMVPNAGQVTPQVELFGSRTRPAFDELGAARTLAQMVVDALLQRDRAARLVAFAARRDAARDGPPLTLGGLIDELVRTTTAGGVEADPKRAALRRAAQRAVVDRLLLLAADTDATPDVRAIAQLKLTELRAAAAARARGAGDVPERAHWMLVASDVGRWIDERVLPPLTQALAAPPGDPF
ncbi:MAG: zinc-dependent metalloprotease [Gemmatimonadaceae bacterium]